MIWIILIVVGALLIKLGALSVLVAVLAVGFKAAIFVIAAMGLLMIWLQYRKQ
jgi:hypothetical protein